MFLKIQLDNYQIYIPNNCLEMYDFVGHICKLQAIFAQLTLKKLVTKNKVIMKNKLFKIFSSFALVTSIIFFSCEKNEVNIDEHSHVDKNKISFKEFLNKTPNQI